MTNKTTGKLVTMMFFFTVAVAMLLSARLSVYAEVTELPEQYEDGVITITLDDDVRLSNGRDISENQNIILDLHGHRIIAENGEAFKVNSGGVLTIKDSSENGSGEITVYSNGYGAIKLNGGMINLEKGSITGTSYGSVIMNTGTFNMNGGTITKQIDQSGGILNMNGGTLTGYLTASNASTVNLKGGTVAASDSSNGAILMNSGTLTLSDKVIFKDNKIDINLRSVSGMSTHYSVMNISEKLTGNPIKICVRKDNSPPSISELPLVLTKGLPGHGTKDNFTFVGDRFELDENDDGELILIPASNATITYHKNDGTDEIITQRAFSDTSQDNPYMTTLRKNTFSRDYYQYVNWNTNSDGSGSSYEDGAKFQLAGSMDLYAMWDLEKFAISYDLGEGNLPFGEKNPETYTFEDKITLVNPNPVSDDYDFMGWTGTGLNQETKDVTIPAGSHGDRNYIANYKMKSYTVSFDTNGGSKIASQNVKIHHKTVKPSDPTWKGYRFVGWYADQGLTIPYNFDQEITADAKVYARWEVLPAPLPVKVIMAKGTPYGTRAIKISWTKVKGASKYKVYAGKCNHKMKETLVTGNTSCVIRKVNKKKMMAHRFYKFRVVALDKNGKILVTSKGIHVLTTKNYRQYANILSIKAKKKEVILNTGGSVKVGATCKLPKRKKHISKKHCNQLRYTSDNPKVASVNAQGLVTAKQPGKATIYIQDTNGMYCTTRIMVNE